jgi:8-amino-7-oxononanoate synthase
MSLDKYFHDQLQSQEEKGILRKLRQINSRLADFTSNDYLGLARSQELRTRIQKVTEHLSLSNGATGSRLLSGNSALCEQLETQLSTTFRAEACLIFNSGYAANIGVLSSIPTRNDTILYDELCHASIKDGIRLSLATRHPFKHNDLNHLAQKLSHSKGKTFVVVESIYSMDGDMCPLADLVALSRKHDFHIILDEAHSTGVMGTNGSGLAASLKLESEVAIRIYTFGKAIGAHGACVAGSKNLINFLINFSRPFIYTTALPDHTFITLAESFQYLAQNPQLQNELFKKVKLFTDNLTNKSNISKSSIQTIILGSVDQTRATANKLSEKGFDVRPIFSPTVSEGKERLRICLHTFNTDEEIFHLTTELNQQ